MKKKYGIALIGTGERGAAYSDALAEYDNMVMAAVCDMREESAIKMQKYYNFRSRYSDYKEAINQEDVDIVIICTPAYFHPEIAVYALERGKHVICEKPVALSLRGAESMIKAAKENNVQLALGFQMHNEYFGAGNLKYMVHNRIIGSPVVMQFSKFQGIRPKTAMHDAKFGNAGPIVDLSCHFIDLMRWFFKSDPVNVTARSLILGKDRPEIAHIEHKPYDTSIIIIEFGSGDIGVITVCWGLPPGVEGALKCSAIGPGGLLEECDPYMNEEIICRLENGRTEKINQIKEGGGKHKFPEILVIEEFINAIEGKGKPLTGGDDGFIALATSLAAIKSSTLDRPVGLSEIYKEMPDVIECMQKSFK